MSKELESLHTKQPDIIAKHNFFANTTPDNVESFILWNPDLFRTAASLLSVSALNINDKEMRLRFRKIYIWLNYLLKINPTYQEMVKRCQHCQLQGAYDFVEIAKDVKARCSGFYKTILHHNNQPLPFKAVLLTGDSKNGSTMIFRSNCGIDPVDLHREVKNLYGGQVSKRRYFGDLIIT